MTKKYYETQAVAWTCFFADVDAIKQIDFMDEKWLDSHGYSSLDDQTMFYKAYLRGIRTMVVVDAIYEHLDAHTSTRNNREPVLYSLNFNRIVFWHRFVFSKQKNVLLKIYATLCVLYYGLWNASFNMFNVIRRRMTIRDFGICLRGYIDGWKYLKTKEYRELPAV